MARIIRLKESDITNIVKKIIRENEEKKRKSSNQMSEKDMRSLMKNTKLTKAQCSKVMEEYNLLRSFKSLVSGYGRMYNKSPKWVQKSAPTPEEMKSKIAEKYGKDGVLPPKGDPSPAAFSICLILANIVFWYCYGALEGWWPSDSRLKENVTRTGVSKSGIPVYNFNYKNDNTLWSGTMAQDLLDMGMGHAVKTMDNGYYAVNYNMIDVDMINQN